MTSADITDREVAALREVAILNRDDLTPGIYTYVVTYPTQKYMSDIVIISVGADTFEYVHIMPGEEGPMVCNKYLSDAGVAPYRHARVGRNFLVRKELASWALQPLQRKSSFDDDFYYKMYKSS